MRGIKDESKPMEPLFPKKRIDDFYQGLSKAPPRSKMASCENYNVGSPSQRLSSGSMEMVNFPSSTSCSGSFVEQLTSADVSEAYQPVFPTMYGFPGPSHLAERNRSTGLNLNTIPPKTEPRLSDSSNFLHKSVPGNLILTKEPNDFKVFCASSLVDDHFQIPTYERKGMMKKHGDHMLQLYKEPSTSSFSSLDNRHFINVRQGNDRGEDRLRDYQGNQGVKQHKFDSKGHFRDPALVLLPVEGRKSAFKPFNPSAGTDVTRRDAKLLKIFDHGEKCILGDKSNTSCYKTLQSEIAKDDTSSVPEKVARERCVTAIDGTSKSLPSPGDRSGLIKIEKDSREEVDIVEKKKEISYTSEKPISSCMISDDVIGAMGETFFCKVRETMVLHQRILAIQVFELHRLFKVQKLLSRSPAILYKNRFMSEERSIKFPPTDKLLYMTPLHPSPLLPKPKINVQMSYPCRNYGIEPSWGNIPPPIVHTENGNPTQQSTSKTFPYANMAQWRFPTPGNQWLLPIKSSSEGLIYKPYTGPCPPNLGLMAPAVYGNCGPIGPSPIGLAAYCVSSLNQHEPGQSSGTGLDQSYFQIEKMKQSAVSDKHWPNLSMNLGVRCQSSSDMQSQKSIVSDSGGNLSGIRDGNTKESSENRTTDHEVVALPLFPTTPTDMVSMQQSKEEKAQAIKAVPHTNQSGLTRILLSIDEGKKKL